ncbi:MAG: deoxyribose-phosphate aldolase [Candidatus Geothermincolia bacterium]
MNAISDRFPSPPDLARVIDATLLRPEAVLKEYREFSVDAADNGYAAAFVPFYHLPYVAEQLKGSRVRLGAALGFPFGHALTDVKKYEAVLALQYGARELDMVLNVTALKSGKTEDARADIAEVVKIARRYDAGREESKTTVKVILETCYLTKPEMRAAAELVVEAGADFVKTSTGYGPYGARVEDVALLRRVVGPGFGVKASGGIRTLAQLLQMVEAGASRIGTSAASAIMAEYLHGFSW